jgi:hypothetical protein
LRTDRPASIVKGETSLSRTFVAEQTVARLFISHSSANDAEAVAIRDWLAAEGWDDVFLDLDPERGIKAGERWERALNEAASRCEAVLFLVSRAWLASRWCLREFNLARRLNKRLFAAAIEAMPLGELPEDLTGEWQVADLSGGQSLPSRGVRGRFSTVRCRFVRPSIGLVARDRFLGANSPR